MTHASVRLILERRLPLSGYFTYRCRFQIKAPDVELNVQNAASTTRMSVNSARAPGCAPIGRSVPSAFRVLLIALGERPATKVRTIR